MKNIVKVLSVEKATHDVLIIKAEKPEGINYQPGQAVDFSINKKHWENEIRPFTFTSLPNDQFIEFTIKIYPEHKGVTNELLKLEVGDEVVIQDVFGDIHYKGEGMFIAGGAGITPFIAILKHLYANNEIGNNKLLFANKKKEDIILETYFNTLLSNNFFNILSQEKLDGYEQGYITPELIKKHSDASTKYYYLCGPEPMMLAIEKHLASLGIEENRIVKEGF